jgi:hypothetical protein
LAENSAALNPSKRKRASLPPAALIAGAVLAVGVAGFWYLGRPGPPKEQAPLTGPAKAYVRSLKLGNVDMQAHESYLKQSIVEITGNLGNTGDRILKSVEINCVFYDPYGKLLLRPAPWRRARPSPSAWPSIMSPKAGIKPCRRW